eukprot:2013015-Prymnesium_polylepis.1
MVQRLLRPAEPRRSRRSAFGQGPASRRSLGGGARPCRSTIRRSSRDRNARAGRAGHAGPARGLPAARGQPGAARMDRRAARPVQVAGLHEAGATYCEDRGHRHLAAAGRLLYTPEATVDVRYDQQKPLTTRQVKWIRDRTGYVPDGNGSFGRP